MTLEERFWSKVDISLGADGEPDGEKHWMWVACVDKDGYGIFRGDGKTFLAHRIAYELNKGEIGEMCVLHTCDIPGCCNPEHLWLGTLKDNSQDCIKKGRGNKACGDKNGTRTHPESVARGDKNGRAKLTWDKVREIRASLETPRVLAERYSVGKSSVSYILSGKRWKE